MYDGTNLKGFQKIPVRLLCHPMFRNQMKLLSDKPRNVCDRKQKVEAVYEEREHTFYTVMQRNTDK